MTERWISTPKYYCKYCNTWFPDTKVQHQQHELSDRHKRNMQKNIARIQRNDSIARQSGLNPIPPTNTTSNTSTRKQVANTANYGYGDRDDMSRWIAQGKKMNFENVPVPQAPVSQGAMEPKVGKWEVTQVITQEKDEKQEGVKKEETYEPDTAKIPVPNVRKPVDSGKRERARTPDTDDLLRFKVEEKAYPMGDKDEDGETRGPVVGFKKRKVGAKSSRVSTAI